MAKYEATMPEEKSMPQTNNQISEVKQFLAERQNAGLLIDPDTAVAASAASNGGMRANAARRPATAARGGTPRVGTA
jgi:hypothetical protein